MKVKSGPFSRHLQPETNRLEILNTRLSYFLVRQLRLLCRTLQMMLLVSPSMIPSTLLDAGSTWASSNKNELLGKS
jgi:hypothetical protein